MALRAFLALLPALAAADKWAVIAAGSKGFWNYRHQADACHAYQLMLKSGIPERGLFLRPCEGGLLGGELSRLPAEAATGAP
mmetsp:Transcript_49051/g.115320  ORF Transcript_49051/g.115320 Transcript_49051/m.115320 type:complete len:82 (-) Transcript_49051:268-513(-)